MILENLSSKTGKEELQKLHKSILIEIDKISNKMNMSSKNAPVNNRFNSHNSNNNLGLLEQNSNLISSDTVLDFELIRKIDNKIENNTKEINKIFQSIIEIREKLSEIDKVQMKDQIYLETTLNKLYQKNSMVSFDNIQNNNNAIDYNEMINNLANLSRDIKEKVKVIQSKFEIVEVKQENTNKEILGKLKKELVTESTRILLEFKTNLKNSMTQIQDQLHDKVDRLNLDEIARKIDIKITQEVSRKLDKNELKKNTSVLNKKVNKIKKFYEFR